MNKYTVLVIMLVVAICVGSVSIPKAFSQTSKLNTNVKVLSYSWYASPSNGDLIVVGEVQNTGNFVLSTVSLNAAVYASDGTELVSSSTMAYVSYLLPQQKAPFYIDFGNPGTGTSVTSNVGYVDFTPSNAPTTNDQEYGVGLSSQDEILSLNPVFNVTNNGVYLVLGSITNNGNQTADGIRVVGTYYNSAGTVIAVGFNNVTGSLTPNNSTTFTVTEFDATPSLVAQISNYSLLVQTSTLQNALSSASPALSSSSSVLIYGVIGAAVIVVVAVTALVFLRKRRNLPIPPPPPPPSS